MKITKETKMYTKPIMFGDGEDGLFVQQHNLLIGDHDTGVVITVTGNVGRDNTKRIFVFDGIDYDTGEEALRAAGHEFEVEECKR